MNPFNPQRPIDPKFFYGRWNIIKDYKYNLKEGIESTTTNMALIGEFGVGKTALLRKLESIEITEHKILKIYMTINEADCESFESLLDCILYNIEKESPGIKFPVEVKEINIKWISIGKKEQAALQKFIENFKKIWETCQNKRYELIVLFIDDFYLANRYRMHLRNLFQDLPRKGIKCMIVCTMIPDFLETGTVTDPLKRYLELHNLNEFSKRDTKAMIQYVIKKASLDLHISDTVLSKIHKETDGHPWFITIFMREIVKFREEGRFDVRNYRNLLPKIMSNVKLNLDKQFSSLTQREEEILEKIVQLDENVFSPRDLDEDSLGTHLSNLVEKDVLIKRARGKYTLFHPLYKKYFRERFLSQ